MSLTTAATSGAAGSRASTLARRALSAAFATASVGLLAACGSSDEGGAGKQASEADVAGAKATVAKYTAPLKSFNLPPLDKLPPRGKKIAFVYNNTPNTKSNLLGGQQAAKEFGWTTIPIIFDPSKPTGLPDAFAQALDANPDAVVTAGQDVKDFAATAKQLAARDIPVVTSSTADEVKPPLIANVTDANQTALAARLTANYAVAQKGADANAALFNIPSFSILGVYEKAFKAEFSRLCPSCKFKSVAVQIGDIGTKLPAQVASTVQTDPKINFAVMGFGAIATGVPAALKTAGVADVKVIGEAPDLTNISNLSNGTEDMWVGYPLFGTGWKSVDALARHFSNQSVEESTTAPTPFQILTKDNAPKPAALPEVQGYQEYFRELWKTK